MTALLLVDIQNDFLPGGALEVKNGDLILPVVNRLLDHKFDHILASKDWHPADHCSFAPIHHKKSGDHVFINGAAQILWPIHCVENTSGSEFPSALKSSKIEKVFYKGTDRTIDSYSAFYDNAHCKSTGLSEFLREKGISNIYVAGLATDYCVKYSVLDAINSGFNVCVIADACKGVNLNPHDSETALNEMKKAGASIVLSKELY